MLPDFYRHPVAPFTAEILAEAGAHAAAESPRESCGLVRAGCYVPCKNRSDTPEVEFVIGQEEMAEAVLAGDLEGIIHSHPGGPWRPSQHDATAQIATGVPWAILVPGETGAELACHWGTQRPPVFDEAGHHVPRRFKHQIADCYSLMEDYFLQECGLRLPKVAREWGWWKKGQTLYLDHLQESGFEVISRDPSEYASIARPRDAFLMQLQSPATPNHAGVYLGNGICLDHMFRELSRTSAIQPRFNEITHWLRHKNL